MIDQILRPSRGGGGGGGNEGFHNRVVPPKI